MIKSVMLGHAVGDALGVPVEFCSREYLRKHPVTYMKGFGTYEVPAGCWSDDTSMALCALESLIGGSINYNDIMRNFGRWCRNGEFTPTGVVFDIGNTCYYAISNYLDFGVPAKQCGLSDSISNGNGSLMRIHPFVLYAYYNGITDENDFVTIIKDASSLTHGHSCSIDGCIIYAYILRALLDNPSKESIFNGLKQAKKHITSSTNYYYRLLDENISTSSESNIKSTGYVVDTLEAAVWCLLTTESYKDCVLKAVNLGSDTDTVAAIAGGLAGALYGIDSIPKDWINTLKRKNYIENMCENAYVKWRVNA